MHRVGHTATQAGSSPFSTRWMQKVHLSAYPSGWMKRALYGHEATHALHPMHASASTSTTEPVLCTWLAPVGQQLTQGGSSQWLQRSLRISSWRFGHAPP